MIHPNVIVYMQRSFNLKSRKTTSVLGLPVNMGSAETDRGIIDKIRSQPKPNEISERSTSSFKTDVAQMVELMGAYCKPNSITQIYRIVDEIHSTLNDKDPPEIKNWIRLLTGLHPEIDKKIKNLGYWKMPYSEVIGTNTVLYYPMPDSIDITNWAKEPKFTTNEVEWFTDPWESPHYIRESLRQKLDSSAVEMIQNANHMTTKYLRRNLVWESRLTTKDGTGAEIPQERPIEREVPAINHGASLNNDWYFQKLRVMPECKSISRDNAISHLKSGGSNVHLLVNHLTPLTNVNTSQNVLARFKSPMGIEETFPRRSTTTTTDIDNSGQKVLRTPSAVNNDVMQPEIIQGE